MNYADNGVSVQLSEFYAKKLKILCAYLANSVHHFCEFCTLFQADFSTLKLSVTFLYDSVCHASIRA